MALSPRRTRTFIESVINAFSHVKFEFPGAHTSTQRTLGFASEAIVEIRAGPPMEVSLLFSPTPLPDQAAATAVYLATLAGVTKVEFTSWLRDQLDSNASRQCWTSHGDFGLACVGVERLADQLMLVSVSSRPRDPTRPH